MKCKVKVRYHYYYYYKGSGKEVKIQEFVYRDTTIVEPEMYDYTSNNCSQWNSNEKLEENFGSCTGKTFDRFTTKDSCTWNITYNTESTAVCNLKSERWGSPLVQEKYQDYYYYYLQLSQAILPIFLYFCTSVHCLILPHFPCMSMCSSAPTLPCLYYYYYYYYYL